MLEGRLTYNPDTDLYHLETEDGRQIKVNTLMYGLADLGSFFPHVDDAGEGEKVRILFEKVE